VVNGFGGDVAFEQAVTLFGAGEMSNKNSPNLYRLASRQVR
jgi:hypothetical protein